MKNIRIQSLTLTDRNGKRKRISEPLFGRIIYSIDAGRHIIKVKSFWGYEKIIIPSNEDRLEMESR